MGNKLGNRMANKQICLLDVVPEEIPNFSLRRSRLVYEIAADLNMGTVYHLLGT